MTKELRKLAFIKRVKSIKIHGYNYDYSLVNYIRSNVKVDIICNKSHGVFKQTPAHHLSDKGCPKCVGKNKTNNEFILEAKLKHGDEYDYSLFEYMGSHINGKIICLKHGHGVFEQQPHNHLKGKGCPICKTSRGEKVIRRYLLDNNITFTRQKIFKDCKDIKPLPFDFYLDELNICIEFDGKQHFECIEHWGGEKELDNVKKRDSIKTNYCNKNGVYLLRIKYNDPINDILINNTYINHKC